MAGNSSASFGWLLQTYQLSTNGFKQLDSGGSTGVKIGDYLAKVRFNSDASSSVYQQLELKVGKTSQESRETYLGLTDEDFDRDPLRRYSASQRDRFDSDHQQYQLTYLLAPSQKLDITTSAYNNVFRRNWYKLNSVAGSDISDVLEDPDDFSNELAVLKGADSQEDALKVRANNRRYYSRGIQSVAGLRLAAAVPGTSSKSGSVITRIRKIASSTKMVSKCRKVTWSPPARELPEANPTVSGMPRPWRFLPRTQWKEDDGA